MLRGNVSCWLRPLGVAALLAVVVTAQFTKAANAQKASEKVSNELLDLSFAGPTARVPPARLLKELPAIATGLQ